MKKISLSSTVWIGLGWGLLVGCTPFFEPISLKAQVTLGLGLFLTYLSLGILLDLIPFPAWVRGTCTKWIWGAVFGALYSLPGAVFTMTPYPLADGAPAYFREFASGGFRAFFLTLGFGALVGLTALLARKMPSLK
jgi:hypothetical protein